MYSQDAHVIQLTNRLVHALGPSFDFVALPHGQGFGWVTATISIDKAVFQVTSFRDGKFQVSAHEKQDWLQSVNANADQYAGHVEALLNGELALS